MHQGNISRDLNEKIMSASRQDLVFDKLDTIDLVSVIVPAYNAEKYIKQTVAAIQNQTYKNWELIIVNDGSTDSTADIVNSLLASDDRIQFFSLDKNYGFPAVARNTGVQKAKGQWVAMCDSDDIWHPKKLELQLKALNKNKDVFCSTGLQNFSSESEIKFEDPGNTVLEKVDFKRQLRRIRTPTSSIVIKRELMLEQPFREDEVVRAREDIECWLRIHEHIDRSIKINYPLIWYRVSDNQLSASKMKMIKLTLKVFKAYTFRSGKKMGWKAYWYTFTHSLYAFYFRIILNKM